MPTKIIQKIKTFLICHKIFLVLKYFILKKLYALPPQVGLPELSETAPDTAARLLQFLANQQRWVPEPTLVAPAARALLGALASGTLPSPLHAPLLYSLARAATTRRAPPPKPVTAAPASQAAPSPPPPPPSQPTPLSRHQWAPHRPHPP